MVRESVGPTHNRNKSWPLLEDVIKNTELANIDIETGKDLVDLKVAEKFRKRIRLCSDNHINELRKNQKFCDRPGDDQNIAE